MSKKQKIQTTEKPQSKILPILILGVVLIAAAIWWWKSKQSETYPNTSGASTEKMSAVPNQDFQELKGKWVRPDGGYVLEIKDVKSDGLVDALYFNPRSIHVSTAKVSQDKSDIKVFIELRDANYPGSTYDLIYKPENDQLKGVYYHAGLKQTFDVTFVRGQ